MVDQIRKELETGKLAEAELQISSLLKSDPENPEALTLKGILLFKSGRFELALEYFRNVLIKQPYQVEALCGQARVQHTLGRPQEAVSCLLKSLEKQRDDPEVFNLLGICLLALGRAAEAANAFMCSISLNSEVAATHANLGMSLRLQNQGVEAVISFKKAVELDPTEPQNFLQLFKQLQQLSRWDEAVDVLKRGMYQHPSSISLAEALALTYGRLNRGQEAEAIFMRISEQSALAANQYATWLQEQGRFEDSVAVLHQSLKLQPVQGVAYRGLVEARQACVEDNAILDVAVQLLESSQLSSVERMHLYYAMGKIYDTEKKYREAVGAYDSANEIAYRTYPSCRTFDPVWTRREPDLISELYSREFMGRFSALGSPDCRPIFIVGMIRSGTTLLDQVVSSHPDVISVGEPTFWNVEADRLHPRWKNAGPTKVELSELGDSYLRSVSIPKDSQRFTDKMPLNYRNLGPILVTFPRAKVLHIRRDPFDTWLSIYTTFFAGGPNFAYKQENIVTFYRAYLKYMEHWRSILPADQFFELDYESLASNPEQTIREVLKFLGLPWHNDCLQHKQNKNQISTPSRWQARQPVYTSSIGKRKIYAEYLGALSTL